MLKDGYPCETTVSRAVDKVNKPFQEPNHDSVWEMVNIRPTKTGLTKVVYASVKQASHGPRIKLGVSADRAVPGQWVTISISDTPELLDPLPKTISQNDVDLAKQWILRNKELLLQYWNDELESEDFLKQLRKI